MLVQVCPELCKGICGLPDRRVKGCLGPRFILPKKFLKVVSCVPYAASACIP